MSIEIYCCDNLDLLKTLPSNYVNLMYNDILYATGRKFSDFQDLKPIRNEVENHYIPRFTEMKRVLKTDGTIFIQCDYRINHWIRCIMDDIFGYENFLNEIIWNYNSAPRKKNSFGNRHDTIFRYSKSSQYTFNEDEVREPYSLSAPRGYEKEKYYNDKGKVMGDVWKLNILGQNDKTERVGYDTQKPKHLLERIIKSCSNRGDLVADFYAGSHTTGVVASEWGRSYIGCDINLRTIEIAKERIK